MIFKYLAHFSFLFPRLVLFGAFLAPAHGLQWSSPSTGRSAVPLRFFHPFDRCPGGSPAANHAGGADENHKIPNYFMSQFQKPVDIIPVEAEIQYFRNILDTGGRRWDAF